MIMVHRPFYFYWTNQGWCPAQPLPAGSQPLEVCFSAAENICQILESHVENLQRFPCDLIFPIFTTASTLSHYRQVNQGGKDESITRRLAMCIKWLSILGSNWKNAGKSQEKLTKGMLYAPIPNPAALTIGFAFAFAVKFTFTFMFLTNNCHERSWYRL